SVLPAGTQEVVDTAMAKSPDERYQSAVDLASAIEALLGGSRPMTPIAGIPVVARKNSDSTTAVAPTMVSDAEDLGPTHHDRRWSRPLLSFFMLVLGIGGGIAYLTYRGKTEEARDAGVVATNTIDAAAIDAAVPVTPDAAQAVAVVPDAADVV